MIGKTISHYIIREKLGEGGMGEVYLAEDTKLNRRVALKFLPSEYASDKEFKARFTREARAAAGLNHPNIITVYEVAEYQDQLYIAMEYVEGKSLKVLITEKELPVSKIIDIASQICKGMANAHEAGIVHRDIKPQNILIDQKGRVRILDFGLAKVKEGTTLTRTRSTLGTVSYMSPEQAQREEVDHRSDIFSFGIVLYEMITGELPFKGDHEGAVLHSIIYEEPQPIPQVSKEVPGIQLTILKKALEKDRALRYQNMGDILTELQAVKEDKKAIDRAFFFLDKILLKRRSLKRFRWKKPVLYLIGTLIGIVLGIVIVVPMFVKPGETSPPPTNDIFILKDILVEPLLSIDSTNQIVRLTLRNLDSTYIWVYGIVGKNPAGGKVLFRRFHKLKSLGLIPPDSSVTIELEYWELEPMNIDSLYFYFKDRDGLIRGPKGVVMLPIS